MGINDMFRKLVGYPCKKASVEKLDDMLWDIYYGETAYIKPFVRETAPENILWAQVRHLRIIGDDAPQYVERFQKKGIGRGFHLSADGSWLMVNLPEQSHPEDHLCRCGPNLESLELWNIRMDTLELLETISGLARLRIMDCSGLTKIPGLEHLTQLTKLGLLDCKQLTALPGLEHLTQLTTLFLYGCAQLTAVPGLEHLTQLTTLDLSWCERLTALPSLEHLTQLTTLNLSRCEQLTALPSLEHLTQLTKLDLSWCERLTAVPGLEHLTQLTTLILSGCEQLTALPGLEHLTQLMELGLWACESLRELPDGIRHLKKLRKLDLGYCHFRTLPDWLPEIAEGFARDYVFDSGNNKAVVVLRNTIVDDIPDMSIFDQPYEVVAEFFRNRSQGSVRILNEIKVVFLGDGEAGKSHTIARLMNDGGEPKGYVDVRTPGIVIKDLSCNVGDRDATLHIWDFGGQDILHSMHRIFLTERTIYVVLVDGSIGNQDERARYWLQNIQSFAKDAPVVLVLNKLDDGLQADVNAVDLYDKFPGLKRIVKLSALKYPRKQFNEDFRDVLLEEIGKTGYLNAQWPDGWIRVKKALEQMEQNYIHGGDYLKICKDNQVDTNQQPLLKWFHDLGVSFCYCDSENEALEDYVVLKPNWITNALYIILFNEREGGNGGLVPVHTIRNMLKWDSPNRDAIKRVIPDAFYAGYEVNYVLDVFHAFQLSFRKDDQHEFFPMLADVNAKSVAKEYSEDEDCLEFRMEFDYTPPNNLLHRLMVARNEELDIENVWRTGAHFQLKELGLSAVVVIDGNLLRFFIRHTNADHRPNTYLTMLKANVDRIVEKMGLKKPTCQLIYKLDGKVGSFEYEDLRQAWEDGEREIYARTWRRRIPIQDIFNQSAPEGLEDERKLLNAIHRSCQYIQGESKYRLVVDSQGKYVNGRDMEDFRNRRVRDDLEKGGYNVKDQTQRGGGELDLLLYNEKRELWTIIECLRVDSGAKTDWNKHLDKLLGKYNFFGARFAYLLTYVDADPKDFDRIWKDYQTHLKSHSPASHDYVKGSYVELNEKAPQYIKTAKCRYTTGTDDTTVYHIFVRIDKA